MSLMNKINGKERTDAAPRQNPAMEGMLVGVLKSVGIDPNMIAKVGKDLELTVQWFKDSSDRQERMLIALLQAQGKTDAEIDFIRLSQAHEPEPGSDHNSGG
jgi:hypothetical protein